MQLTTSSGPMLVAGHDLAHQLLGGGEDRAALVARRRWWRRAGRRGASARHHASHAPRGRRPARLPRRLRRGRQAQLRSPPSAPRELTVTSPDFPANGAIPRASRATATRRGPALRFAGVPAGAAELALSSSTPTRAASCTGPRTRCRPARGRSAPPGCPPARARARTRPARRGWTPPCPPSGTHRYEFRLYWLQARERARARAPSPTRSSPRCARARAAAACWWGATSAAEARARSRAGARPRRRVSRRWRPAVRSPRRSGPKATRRRSTHRVADRLAHPPHLALAALVDRQLELVRADAGARWAGAVRPSSSSTPSRSARSARSLGRPSTRAR